MISKSREFDEITPEDRKIVSNFFQFYLKELNLNPKSLNADNIKALTDAYGDVVFNAVVDWTTQQIVKHSDHDVFEYIYEYEGSTSLTDFLTASVPKMIAKVFFITLILTMSIYG